MLWIIFIRGRKKNHCIKSIKRPLLTTLCWLWDMFCSTLLNFPLSNCYNSSDLCDPICALLPYTVSQSRLSHGAYVAFKKLHNTRKKGNNIENIDTVIIMILSQFTHTLTSCIISANLNTKLISIHPFSKHLSPQGSLASWSLSQLF